MKKNDHVSPIGHPLIIPIFIMNSGCAHRCIFCNQRITAGNYPPVISKDYFDAEVESYLNRNKDKSRKVEIAFYGGNFTGVNPDYQNDLLCWAQAFIQTGRVNSIRISTRPDYISEDKLQFLKKYGVDTVEIGAQSFVNDVLRQARRGHNAEDIRKAMTVLKKNGFKSGLHLMAGLPRETLKDFLYSIDQTIAVNPDTVRIHPVLVFKETELAERFEKGGYRPLDLIEAVEWCRLAWVKLALAGVPVIRMGLQTTPEMEKEGAVVAGPAHPAFGNLVLSSVFYHQSIQLLKQVSGDVKEMIFSVASRDVSIFRGVKNTNVKAIKRLYPHVKLIVRSDTDQPRGELKVTTDGGESFQGKIPGS